MKQVIHDLYLKLQSDRKTQIIAVTGIALLATFFVLENKHSRTLIARDTPSRLVQDLSEVRLKNDEAFNDLAAYVGSQLDENRESAKRNESQIAALREDMNLFQQRMVEVIKKVVERDSAFSYTRPPSESTLPPIEPQAESELGPVISTSVEMEEFGDFGEFEAAPPDRVFRKRVARVSAGDRVRARLDTGITAVADGTPYPVVFHLTSDVYGPNGSVLPLGEAYLVAAAQASLPDSRVLFRLVTLTIQLPNGHRKEIDVDGWIAGEDGIRGMAGVSFDPLGQKLAAAAMVGATQGVSEGIQSAQFTTTSNLNGTQKIFTGDIGKLAGASALTAGANVWTTYINKRMDLYPPYVEVMSGRDVTVVFAQPFSVSGLFEALEEEPDHLELFD